MQHAQCPGHGEWLENHIKKEFFEVTIPKFAGMMYDASTAALLCANDIQKQAQVQG